MHKPKVFVTRLIPAAGLEQVRGYCDADIWTEPLPPPAASRITFPKTVVSMETACSCSPATPTRPAFP